MIEDTLYKIRYTSKFKKDIKNAIKRGYDISLLEEVIEQLAMGQALDELYLDHPLKGNYIGFRECHILPDWLMIYKREENFLVLTLTRTGTHSDLF